MSMPLRSVASSFSACLALAGSAGAAEPELQAATGAVRAHIDQNEVAGAVTLVATPDRLVHLSAVGFADRESQRAMTPDSLFWIASMTKPVTASAVMMLWDEGKISLDDTASKYIPAFAGLKTKDGKPAAPTLRHLLTHTSGLAEPTLDEALAARNLEELMPHVVSKPLLFQPGARWQYCQSGINALGRIVEVVSGKPFQVFLSERLFLPLGMKDTTFYPSAAQRARLATSYKRTDGQLVPAALMPLIDPARGDARYPAPNGGLFSTASDYARFCQMLLNEGALDGRRYLSSEAVAQMSKVQSGDLKTGFTEGNGWGLGCCVVRQPQGPSAALSPGSFGHGGAYGTQAWIDPARKVAYLLMVQRADFPNSDASAVRSDFQRAAATALGFPVP